MKKLIGLAFVLSFLLTPTLAWQERFHSKIFFHSGFEDCTVEIKQWPDSADDYLDITNCLNEPDLSLKLNLPKSPIKGYNFWLFSSSISNRYYNIIGVTWEDDIEEVISAQLFCIIPIHLMIVSITLVGIRKYVVNRAAKK